MKKYISLILTITIILSIFIAPVSASSFSSSNDEKIYSYEDIKSLLADSYSNASKILTEEVKFNSINFPLDSNERSTSSITYYICDRTDGKMLTSRGNYLSMTTYYAANGYQKWLFDEISDGVYIVRIPRDPAKCLTAVPNSTTSTVTISDYSAGNTNQYWSISLSNTGNSLVSESTNSLANGKKLYKDGDSYTLSSSNFTPYGFIDADWWIPCTTINMSDLTLEMRDQRYLYPTCLGANSAVANVSSPDVWLDFSVSDSDVVSFNKNLVSARMAGIKEIKITHRITNVSVYFIIYVQPKIGLLDVTPHAQVEDFWCWAACATMVGTYINPNTNKSLEDVVRYTFGELSDSPGSLQQAANGANYIANNTQNFYFSLQLTEADICYDIADRKPILAGLVSSNNTIGHMVVIVGCKVTGTTSNTVYEITYIDPLTAQYNTVTYDELTTRIPSNGLHLQECARY